MIQCKCSRIYCIIFKLYYIDLLFTYIYMWYGVYIYIYIYIYMWCKCKTNIKKTAANQVKNLHSAPNMLWQHFSQHYLTPNLNNEWFSCLSLISFAFLSFPSLPLACLSYPFLSFHFLSFPLVWWHLSQTSEQHENLHFCHANFQRCIEHTPRKPFAHHEKKIRCLRCHVVPKAFQNANPQMAHHIRDDFSGGGTI